jgi:thioredoxin-like negative regulator of GroEL
MKVMKFYSPCCGQCKVVAKEFKDHPIDASVKDINVMENPEVADKYNVKSLPTILLLNDKEEVLETWHGIVKSEVINSKIKEYGSNSSTGNSLE